MRSDLYAMNFQKQIWLRLVAAILGLVPLPGDAWRSIICSMSLLLLCRPPLSPKSFSLLLVYSLLMLCLHLLELLLLLLLFLLLFLLFLLLLLVHIFLASREVRSIFCCCCCYSFCFCCCCCFCYLHTSRS